MRLKDLDYAALRRLIGQWRQIAPNYYGDFYPLTPWTRDNTVWMAWQFDRPETGEGMVQAFRRHESDYESARLRLRGLDADATYVVTDLDTGAAGIPHRPRPARQGLLVTIADRPGTAPSDVSQTAIEGGPGNLSRNYRLILRSAIRHLSLTRRCLVCYDSLRSTECRFLTVLWQEVCHAGEAARETCLIPFPGSHSETQRF